MTRAVAEESGCRTQRVDRPCRVPARNPAAAERAVEREMRRIETIEVGRGARPVCNQWTQFAEFPRFRQAGGRITSKSP